ncbi:MAG: hypothetical protein V2A75_08160 [Pseudomonadota bacterium]
MNKCDQYFSAETSDAFWSDFAELYKNNNATYLPSRASNVLSCKCIEFPDITEASIFDYFFPSNTQIADSLNFINCKFQGEFDSSKFQKLKNLTFDNCEFMANADISLASGEKIIINDSVFNANFRIIGFDSRHDSKKFDLKNCSFSAIVDIENCILEKAKLINIDFKKATLIFKHTQFEGIKFNEVHWGKKYQANRDTFRQLKVVLENQKNFIDSQLFYSLELNEYRKELKQTKLFENIEDKFLFSFNRIVSNYGQSWTLPLFWLITLSIALYMGLYCLGLILTYNFNDFMHFFNPLSRTAGEKFDNIYGIWFLHKIFAGFLIYQFIVAAKRKTKL